jgi:hypothetical protein
VCDVSELNKLPYLNKTHQDLPIIYYCTCEAKGNKPAE